MVQLNHYIVGAGIVSEPSAYSQNRTLVLRHGDSDADPIKIPSQISVCDLADLIVLSMTNERFTRATAVCSSQDLIGDESYQPWQELVEKHVKLSFIVSLFYS